MKKEGEKKIGEIFSQVFKSRKLAPTYYHNRITAIWKDEMGPAINSYTKALNLRKRTLYIHIESAALKQELAMSKEKVMAMINRALGETFLEEIHIQ